MQQLLQMKGIVGIHEEEMLKAFELALRPQVSLPPNTDHIIVGMQPRVFGPASKVAGLDMDIIQREDRRLNWVALAVKDQLGHTTGGNTRSPEGIRTTMERAASKNEAIVAVEAHISRTLAKLLMMEEESIQTQHKSVSSYGLDSMIGAEFRNRVFRDFDIDIPFQQLIAGGLTISELAKLLYETHLERGLVMDG